MCWRGISDGQGKFRQRWRGRHKRCRHEVLQYKYLRWIRTEISLTHKKQFIFRQIIFQYFYYMVIWKSVCKVHDDLHWVFFLVRKTFSYIFVNLSVIFTQEIFGYKLYPIYFLLLLTKITYIKSFLITMIIK